MFDPYSPFSMVVMIVLIAVGAGVINNYLKLKAEGANNAADDGEIRAMREEIAALKSRVRVLEEIAVDKDTRLKEEISRLA